MDWSLILKRIKNRFVDKGIKVQNIILEDECRVRVYTDLVDEYHKIIDICKPFRVGIDTYEEAGFESVVIFD